MMNESLHIHKNLINAQDFALFLEAYLASSAAYSHMIESRCQSSASASEKRDIAALYSHYHEGLKSGFLDSNFFHPSDLDRSYGSLYKKLNEVNNLVYPRDQMELEIETPKKSLVYNAYEFVEEELSFAPEDNFFKGRDDSQHIEELSAYEELKTENELSEIIVKCEVKMEEEEVGPLPRSFITPASIFLKNTGNPQPFAQVQQSMTQFNLEKEEFLKKIEPESQSQADSSRKKRPGKNPYTMPKDVGRHFLKVHMKKCMNYVLKHLDEVYEELRAYFFDNCDEPPAFTEKDQKEFILKKSMEFKDWLESLRKAFKDYGKEDFKTAYMHQSKQFGQEISNVKEEDLSKFLKGRPNDWNKMVFKEILRRISLRFVKNRGEDGLRYQLVNANNILVEEEHLKYVILTEWLMEKPARIESSEIFGKVWVEKFFRSRNLI